MHEIAGVFLVVNHVIHTTPWMDLMSMVSYLWNNQHVWSSKC